MRDDLTTGRVRGASRAALLRARRRQRRSHEGPPGAMKDHGKGGASLGLVVTGRRETRCAQRRGPGAAGRPKEAPLGAGPSLAISPTPGSGDGGSISVWIQRMCSSDGSC